MGLRNYTSLKFRTKKQFLCFLVVRFGKEVPQGFWLSVEACDFFSLRVIQWDKFNKTTDSVPWILSLLAIHIDSSCLFFWMQSTWMDFTRLAVSSLYYLAALNTKTVFVAVVPNHCSGGHNCALGCFKVLPKVPSILF